MIQVQRFHKAAGGHFQQGMLYYMGVKDKFAYRSWNEASNLLNSEFAQKQIEFMGFV